MSKTALWNDMKVLVSKLEEMGHPLAEDFLEHLEYHKTYEQKRAERRVQFQAQSVPKPIAARSWATVKDKPKPEDEVSDIFSNATTEQERLEAIKRLMSE